MDILDNYTGLPLELVLMCIKEDMVTEISGRLSGGAGSGGDGLGDPETLFPGIQGSNHRGTADSGRLFGVDREQATPWGRLLVVDEHKTDRTGQAARGHSGRGG